MENMVELTNKTVSESQQLLTPQPQPQLQPLVPHRHSFANGTELAELKLMAQQHQQQHHLQQQLLKVATSNHHYATDINITSSSASDTSSSSTSPNSARLNSSGSELDILNQVVDCNYLLKQMNKRKLHLPCPLCKSLVVNMSDHLAKTHMIVDFKQRKQLLNVVRHNHIMNPTGLKELLDNNKFLLDSSSSSNVKEESSSGESGESGVVSPQPLPSASTVLTSSSEMGSSPGGLSDKLQELLKMARASVGIENTPTTLPLTSVLTPEQSDIDRFSEESETNNSKHHFFVKIISI